MSPGLSSWLSLLHLQALSRMTLCAVIVSTLEINVKPSSSTLRHIFPFFQMTWRHVWRMVISLFKNSDSALPRWLSGKESACQSMKTCENVSCTVMSFSLRFHGLKPTKLQCPWNSPGRNTGVGSHSLLQGIFPTQRWKLGLLPNAGEMGSIPGLGNPTGLGATKPMCHGYECTLEPANCNDCSPRALELLLRHKRSHPQAKSARHHERAAPALQN